MKTKLLLLPALFSMICFVGNAQCFNIGSAHGFSGYASFGFRNINRPETNTAPENNRIFNLACYSSSDTTGYSTEPGGVINRLTCSAEITDEQIELIFDAAREFPGNTELSISIINSDRVYFYGLKRQSNCVKTVDNRSFLFESGSFSECLLQYCSQSMLTQSRHKRVTRDYTSVMVIDTYNEKGIVILSNVTGFSRKMGKIESLCFDLLATLPDARQ
jgi:hypothetical protein